MLYGDVPRLELFARSKTPGWDAWGNEIEITPGLEVMEPYLLPPYENWADEDEEDGMLTYDPIDTDQIYMPGDQMMLC